MNPRVWVLLLLASWFPLVKPLLAFRASATIGLGHPTVGIEKLARQNGRASLFATRRVLPAVGMGPSPVHAAEGMTSMIVLDATDQTTFVVSVLIHWLLWAKESQEIALFWDALCIATILYHQSALQMF